MKRFLIIAGAILIALGLFFWFYLWRGFEPVPAVSAYPARLDEIRRLAGTTGLPRAIHSIKVAELVFPAWALIAGGAGQDEFPAEFRAFQVDYGDRTVLIDPVHNRALHEEFPFSRAYDDAAFDRMQDWVRSAAVILATHEHWDHVGGVAASPHAELIRPRVLFTKEQIESEWMGDAMFPDGYLASLRPLVYSGYHQVLPGLVLIKAAGHTPGSQMIFVRLRAGDEYLFVGDVVWNDVNLRESRGHSRFVGLGGREDLAAQAHQIRWLKEIRDAGQVRLIIAHDSAAHSEALQRGWFD